MYFTAVWTRVFEHQVRSSYPQDGIDSQHRETGSVPHMLFDRRGSESPLQPCSRDRMIPAINRRRSRIRVNYGSVERHRERGRAVLSRKAFAAVVSASNAKYHGSSSPDLHRPMRNSSSPRDSTAVG